MKAIEITKTVLHVSDAACLMNCSSMKVCSMKNRQLKPAYNVQLAVENEYIVGVGLFPNSPAMKTLIPFSTQ